MLATWKKSYDQPRQHIKKQRHYFANKDPSSQGYGFSNGHVWMWELDYKESLAPKNWCFWTVVLDKTFESPLDCKKMQPATAAAKSLQSCPTLCSLVDCSTPGFPVLRHLPKLAQTHVHRVSDAIQPFHPLLSLSPPAPHPSQHQGLFQWVNSSHEVAKVLEFQLQHQSFQWTPRTNLL